MIVIDSISDAVKVVMDDYPVGHQFYGNEYKDDCVKLYPESKDCYVDTFLKMARRHRRDSYICIERNNSLYERVKSNLELEIELRLKEEENLKRSRIDNENVVQMELFCA